MRIIMTGGTSGLGVIAAERLLAAGARMTLGARDVGAAQSRFSRRARVISLDLDSLASTRAFATEATAGAGAIDVLVLNAGLQLSRPAKSAEGFERTFAVNHLAHYLLLRLLKPLLADRARIIITSSGTHDPAEKTPVTPPDHADAELLAYPDRDPMLPSSRRAQMFRAYSSSKLCNILTAQEFARRYPQFSVIAFDPGYAPDTALSRDNPALIAFLAGKIIPLLIPKDRTSTAQSSGERLAELALAPQYANCHGGYWCVRGGSLVERAPSAQAQDADAARRLWADSGRLAGMPVGVA